MARSSIEESLSLLIVLGETVVPCSQIFFDGIRFQRRGLWQGSRITSTR